MIESRPVTGAEEHAPHTRTTNQLHDSHEPLIYRHLLPLRVFLRLRSNMINHFRLRETFLEVQGRITQLRYAMMLDPASNDYVTQRCRLTRYNNWSYNKSPVNVTNLDWRSYSQPPMAYESVRFQVTHAFGYGFFSEAYLLRQQFENM